jgi:glycosyltransferase involved in cell wall biosynthesis
LPDNHHTSIALCTYNGARFLSEQLESFADQTILPGELVVKDDRSTDETVSIVNQFARSAPFPVLLEINPNNLGSTKNFQRAIERCSGDLIFLSDQDDVWKPNKIERMLAEFDRSESVGMVFTDAELTDENLRPLKTRLWEYTFPPQVRRNADGGKFYKTLLKQNTITGATAAFRSKFVRDLVPIPTHIPNLIHDGWIALVISACAEIAFLDDPLIRYRQHPAQQLGIGRDAEMPGRMREDFPRAIEFLTEQKKAIELIAESVDCYDALRNNEDFKAALPEGSDEVQQYIRHLENRLELLDKGLGRIPLITRELASGRYNRFSKGVFSAVKDLLAK